MPKAAKRPGLTQALALMKAFLLLGLIAVSGCTTTDRTETVSHSASIQCLQQLIAKDNFSAVPGSLYTDVQDPTVRAELNNRLNAAVQLLIAAVSRGANESEHLAILNDQINKIARDQLDTEDAEQVASNFELTLDCLHIESSGGILNTWMYGFDPR